MAAVVSKNQVTMLVKNTEGTPSARMARNKKKVAQIGATELRD